MKTKTIFHTNRLFSFAVQLVFLKYLMSSEKKFWNVLTGFNFVCLDPTFSLMKVHFNGHPLLLNFYVFQKTRLQVFKDKLVKLEGKKT